MPPPRHKTAEKVPESGIYTVYHDQHRVPHQVTLLGGEIFPRCSKCGDLVEFELAQAVTPAGKTAFAVRVYALPDLDDPDLRPLSLGLPK